MSGFLGGFNPTMPYYFPIFYILYIIILQRLPALKRRNDDIQRSCTISGNTKQQQHLLLEVTVSSVIVIIIG
jgi:hypothetical protein